jgi:hypothetical protein
MQARTVMERQSAFRGQECSGSALGALVSASEEGFSSDQAGQIGQDKQRGGGNHDQASLTHFVVQHHGGMPLLLLVVTGQRILERGAWWFNTLALLEKSIPAKPGDGTLDF